MIEAPVFPASDFWLTLLTLDASGRTRLRPLTRATRDADAGPRWSEVSGLWLYGGTCGLVVLGPDAREAGADRFRLTVDRAGRLNLGALVGRLCLSRWLVALADDRVAQLILINADRAAAGLMGLTALNARDAVLRPRCARP